MSPLFRVVTTFGRERVPSRIGDSTWLRRTWTGLREIAPYAAIELLLPGGSLLALLCWLYRRSRPASAMRSM